MSAENTVNIPAADTATIDQAIQDGPVLLWATRGQSMPTEIRQALQKAVQSSRGKLRAYTVDVSRETALAERFDIGKHPVLLAFAGGEIVARRSRAWATDVSGIASKLLSHGRTATSTPNPTDKETIVSDKPVTVTDETFEQEVLQSDVPVVVDFWADWCGPCKMVAPILEKLATDYAGQVKVAKVDVDANPALAQHFNIMSIPTLMFVKSGQIVGQSAGAAPEPALRDAFDQLVNLEMPA